MQLQAKEAKSRRRKAREVVGSAKPKGQAEKQAQIDNARVLCRKDPMGYETA